MMYLTTYLLFLCGEGFDETIGKREKEATARKRSGYRILVERGTYSPLVCYFSSRLPFSRGIIVDDRDW